jgi:hypothetical protein
MRAIVVAVITAAGMGVLGAASAAAAPANGAAILQASEQTSQVVTVRAGCGRGWHRGPRGGCRRN